jgi:hypothetical protein
MLGSGLCGSMAMAQVRRARFHGGMVVGVSTTEMLAAMTTTMVAARETTVVAASIYAGSERLPFNGGGYYPKIL